MNAAGRRKTIMTQLQESNVVRGSLLNRLSSAMHDSSNFYAFSPANLPSPTSSLSYWFFAGRGERKEGKNSQVSCLYQSRPRLPGNTMTWLSGDHFSGLTQCPTSHLRIFKEKHGHRWIINAINQVFVQLGLLLIEDKAIQNGWSEAGGKAGIFLPIKNSAVPVGQMMDRQHLLP